MDTIRFFAEYVAYAALFVIGPVAAAVVFDGILDSAIAFVLSKNKRKK